MYENLFRKNVSKNFLRKEMKFFLDQNIKKNYFKKNSLKNVLQNKFIKIYPLKKIQMKKFYTEKNSLKNVLQNKFFKNSPPKKNILIMKKQIKL